jgi:Cu2+-exporting ATPase
VLLRVQRVGGDTRLEAIVSMMKSAMAQRPAAAMLADRWAAPFLWAVLLLAAGAAAVWSVVDPSRAVWVAVSVLIVTCPCALSLAAPATLVAAARGLARRGVLLQRLDALERLAAVQQIFFDKTGTLTDERLQLAAVRLTAAGQDDFDSERVALKRAAGLAQWSTHPLSQALAASISPDTGLAWSDVQESPGQGLQARDADGRTWRLGSATWVGGTGAPVVDDAAVWLGVTGRALACFTFQEGLRAGTAEALRVLQAEGLQLTLLSGDTPARAQALAARLGLTDVRARSTPEAKLAAVTQAQAEGRIVAMVGDGINDAPVLARADVSLAMGQGALVARCQADAVVTSCDLGDLVRARATAQRAVRIVRQNFIWAGLYNATSIPLALTGWLPPWAAGLGMAGSSLLVVLNALRAGR